MMGEDKVEIIMSFFLGTVIFTLLKKKYLAKKATKGP